MCVFIQFQTSYFNTFYTPEAILHLNRCWLNDINMSGMENLITLLLY